MKYLRTQEGRIVSVSDDVYDEVANGDGSLSFCSLGNEGERRTDSVPGMEALKVYLAGRSDSVLTIIMVATAPPFDATTFIDQWGMGKTVKLSELLQNRDNLNGVVFCVCNNRYDIALGDIQITALPTSDNLIHLYMECRWGLRYSIDVSIDSDGLLVEL